MINEYKVQKYENINEFNNIKPKRRKVK